MKYHVSAFFGSQGINVVNADNAVVPDTVLSTRNNHLILQRPLDIRQAFAFGASMTDSRIFSPSLSSPSIPHIFPAMRSATIPSRPVGRNLITYPLRLPTQEEIQNQVSNNLGAATENETAVLVMTPENWTPSISKGVPLNPMGPSTFDVKFTATIGVINGAWSGGTNITLTENLKGGWYALLTGAVQVTGGLAWRVIFPNQMGTSWAPFRPGGLCVNALGDTPEEWQWSMALGDMGYFWSFALPQIEVLSVTGGGTAVTGFLRLAFLGASPQPPGGIV